MSVAIKTLVKQKAKAVPLQLVTTEVAAVRKNGWNYINAFKFKGNLITVLDLYEDMGPHTITLRYLDHSDNIERSTVVPPDFMVENPPTEQAKKMVEAYQQYQLKNLGRFLSYPGTVGTDPEIFCEDETGKIIPAFEFLPAKDKADETDTGNTLYWDGFQAEFTVNAGGCLAYMADSIQFGLKGIFKALKKYNPKAKLSNKTVIDVDLETLKNTKPEHVAFGCMPSLNVYGMKGRDVPGDQTTVRPAGGHLHFGILTDYNGVKYGEKDYENMVKALDAILGVACVSMFAKFDDPRRRQLYGLAGEYRRPTHGLEYRTLSNAWLCHPVITNIVFDLGRNALMFGVNGFLNLWDATQEETIRVINECDVEGARNILKRNKDILFQIINVKYANKATAAFIYQVILEGMENVIKDPTDIVGNWDIERTWTTHCNGKGKNIFTSYSQMMIKVKLKPIL